MAFGPAYTDQPVSYIDWAKRQDPDGSPAQVAELLAKFTPLVQDAFVQPSNMERSHRLTQRRTHPVPTWRGFNQGVKATKSETSQVDEGIGNIEDFALVDKDLADLNGNSVQFMLSESTSHIAAMAEAVEDETWYGDGTNPNGYVGFTPRFNSLTGINSTQVVDAEQFTGTPTTNNDKHSLWFVTWDPSVAFMLTPKGHPSAGIQMTDDGEVVVPTPVLTGAAPGDPVTQGMMRAYRQHYKWMTGLAVRDPRFIVRCCNISDAELQAGDVNLIKMMINAQHRLFKQGIGRGIIYTTRAVATALDVAAVMGPTGGAPATNVNLTHRDYAGEYVLHFRNWPIRECDMLLSGTEQRVT